jgi:hypothetical protein
MSKVFRVHMNIWFALADDPAEGPIGAKDRRYIERQVLRLLERVYPDADGEITIIEIEEEE